MNKNFKNYRFYQIFTQSIILLFDNVIHKIKKSNNDIVSLIFASRNFDQ